MTQKNALELFKNVRVNVLSFDENDRRDSSYCGVNMIVALQEVARRTSEGKKVLILSYEKDNHIGYEIRNKCRVPWIECLKWVVEPGSYMFKYRF